LAGTGQPVTGHAAIEVRADVPALLVNFADRLTYIVPILKGPYLVGLQKQYKAAVDLISLIKKKYNLKDE